jgi:two-component system, NtrC family, response regulator AtoC
MKNLKIFILEDNLFYANLFMARVEEMGYENVQLFSASEELLKEIHQQPSIVFLDHNLPDGKGLDVLKEIKSTYPDVNCIMLSGQAIIGIVVDSYKHGAFDYLLKGVDDSPNELERVINDCINYTRAEHGNLESKSQ